MSTTRALIILDIIEDLVGPSQFLPGNPLPGRFAEAGLLGAINDAIATARSRGDLVVLVNLGFSDNYVDWPESSPIFAPAKLSGGLRLGTAGTEPLTGLDVREGDPVLRKPRVSPFFGTRLDTLLRTHGVESIALAGVATEHVVLAAARDGHDRDYAVTVLTDACTSANDTLRDAAFTVMGYFTTQVTTAEWAERA